ncbi:MAG: thioredoxin family protein [Pseudomonadota bacterium]
MAAVESTMLPLDTELPAFSLTDPDGKRHSPAEGQRAYLVMFICNHCPFVKHIADGLAALGRDYAERGVGIFAINSNDTVAYPQDGLEAMRAEAKARGYVFAYLLDEDQSVAKEYRAACTPDFFVFDAGQRLVYRGQFDDSRPSNDAPVTGHDVRAALEAVLAGHAPVTAQTPSIGCNIKWAPGNAPDYYA